LRGVGIKSFVGYSGKLETYPTVDREPVKLLKKRLRVCEAIRLKNNSGEGILNPLQLICDIVGCAEENRISIVKAGADESMSYK
jgi:hypothetical protein